MEDRVIEFVDHLHEHFVDPVAIRAGITCRRSGRATASRSVPPAREEYAYPLGRGLAGGWESEVQEGTEVRSKKHEAAVATSRLAVAVAGAGCRAAQAPAPPADGAAILVDTWYRQPASQWDHAMPLGNGRLGAMVFGSVNRERIQLNEHSLWLGGPRERDNPDAYKHLAEVRRLLFAGAPVEAYRLADKYLMGRPQRLLSYQTLGDLRLTFDHEDTISDYRRELDLDSAVARVSYRAGDVRVQREVFASHPDQVIVVRITADKPKALNVSIWMDRLQDAVTSIDGDDRLEMAGALDGGKGLRFHATAKVICRRDPRHVSGTHRGGERLRDHDPDRRGDIVSGRRSTVARQRTRRGRIGKDLRSPARRARVGPSAAVPSRVAAAR